MKKINKTSKPKSKNTKRTKRIKNRTSSCFCCDKTITFSGEEFDMPPLSATYWRTCGNYGSGVYDSFPCTQIEMYVCDQCLYEKLNKVYSVDNETLVDISEFPKPR